MKPRSRPEDARRWKKAWLPGPGFRLCSSLVLLGLTARAPAAGAGPASLSNGRIEAAFGDRGLASITDAAGGAPYRFAQEDFSLTIDGHPYESGALSAPSRRAATDRVTYAWAAGPYRLEVVYELRPGWRFLSKQIFIVSGSPGTFRVGDVTVFRSRLAEPIAEVYVPKSGRPDLGTGDSAGCLRLEGGRGLLVLAQNPFLQFHRDASSFAVRYEPDLDWSRDYGPFAADRGLLAPYRQTGRRLPERMLPEWKRGPVAAGGGMDAAEVETFTACVRAFLLYKPARPLNIFVGWCVNDYQIDVAAAPGRAEYKRILDRAAELGAEYVLYAPANSDLSRREESVDDWSWEHVLWLGLGQKIRKGEWAPRSDEVPPSVQEMLDYAGAKGLKLVAYVYPVLPFSHDPEWLVSGKSPERRYASLGFRSLQDWLIETLVAFYRRTGIGGYSFDHTFLRFEGPSRYAQWWGWRRVMETLRQRLPGAVIDGRQAYQHYGPWSWLAGSYPHPTSDDEQPESFTPFPDLHFDRVSADRQRYTAYRYRNYDFAPSEIVPGFITHQTPRSDDTGNMPQTPTERGVMLDRFRPRDWDYLGWRYSLLSSIATAGWNNVLNMIPARDLEEHRHFAEEDKRWFRGWLQWTERNKELLRHTRTILGQPAVGKVDGTSAIVDDRGFLFLFNPNARALTAEITLDPTIGLSRPGRFLLRELYPLEDRLIGKPAAGVWTHGDRVSIPMDGGAARVLEVQPAAAVLREPLLFNAPGAAALADGVLRLTGIRGEAGTDETLLVLLPRARTVDAVRVNDRAREFSRTGEQAVTVAVGFEGTPFHRYQQVGAYDPSFSGGSVAGRVTVPRRVLDQLDARRKAWPIGWTAEDYRSTWLAPERLLLFVQIAEPDDRWEARLKIDGRPIELRKAYSAVRAARSTFVGFYADVSLLAPDREHTVELELPPLEPGQFQGLFFENVEPEYTGGIRR